MSEASWLAEERTLPADREVRPGLTVADLVAFHERPPTPLGAVFEADVPFAKPDRRGEPLVLHRYRRAHPDRQSPAPTALLVHGGAWERGHPFGHIRRACLLAADGWVSATSTYRRLPRARWPDPLDDVRAAMEHLARTSNETGADPSRLALMGDSSGGHLVAMAALTSAQPVSAVVLWYPVTDLTASPELAPAVGRLVGTDPDAQRAASPISHVHPGAPPVLTFVGDSDPFVPLASAHAFHAALDTAGVPNRLVVRPGAGHAFDFDPDAWDETFELARAFLAEHVPV